MANFACPESESAEFSKMIYALINYIHDTPHSYVPRRGKQEPTHSLGWNERLDNYYWRPSKNGDTAETLAQCFTPLSMKIDAGDALSEAENSELVSLARRTFLWGGVVRGNGKSDPSASDVVSVVTAATSWSFNASARMDAGWTKVAAFSTAWLEGSNRHPQIIYDSRVSAGIMRCIEDIINAGRIELSDQFTQYLTKNLKRMPSRTPTRFKALTINWSLSRINDWTSQYFASFLIARITATLNSGEFKALRRDGLTWTTRDVEKVLFMHGY